MCETITTFGDTKLYRRFHFRIARNPFLTYSQITFQKEGKGKKMILLKGGRILINNTDYNIKTKYCNTSELTV